MTFPIKGKLKRAHYREIRIKLKTGSQLGHENELTLKFDYGLPIKSVLSHLLKDEVNVKREFFYFVFSRPEFSVLYLFNTMTKTMVCDDVT